ncbi:MAG: hypothetical protein FWD45_03460 [Coriobacteriia bacterium]|nr:hypothetical protein [Coriobacteriia bacterium]
MAKISPKDNFLKLAGGGMPEYVPYFTYMGTEEIPEIPTKVARAELVVPNPPNPDGSNTSMWGVTTYPNEDTAGSSMPEPDVWILDDITKWGDIIRKPVFKEGMDFEAMAKESFERANLDRNESALRTGIFFGPWMSLVGFMGFEGAMIAMVEEPETVKELFDWMTSLFEPYYTPILDAYQPDIWTIGDDSCTERGPFFSVAMYRDLFKPFYERFAKQAMEREIPIMFHICGFIEPFIPEMIDFGVKYVEPAQETNDVMSLKEQYKGQMSYLGTYDWGKHYPKDYPNYDPEAVKQDVRDAIDKYSPGGAWAPLIWPVSYVGDPHIDDLRRLIWNECYTYGKKVYGYED